MLRIYILRFFDFFFKWTKCLVLQWVCSLSDSPVQYCVLFLMSLCITPLGGTKVSSLFVVAVFLSTFNILHTVKYKVFLICLTEMCIM